MTCAVWSRGGLHPVYQDFAVLQKDIAKFAFYSKVSHFFAVLSHVEELLSVLALVVYYVFVSLGPNHPSECA